MDDGKFILCRKCGSVHHVTPFDKAPDRGLDAAEPAPAIDWRAFMDQHAGHPLEAMKAVGEIYFPGGASSDPMSVAYLRVTAGQNKYLLRRWRRSIAEPLRFERIEGDVETPVMALDVQEHEIRKELKLRFRLADGKPFGDAKVDLFVAAFRATAARMDTRKLIEIAPSYADDNIAYAALDTPARVSLLEECAAHFTPEEVEALRGFVESHSNGSDVMTLVLRRRIVVAEPAY